jgi:hypothetical protein
VNGIAGHPYALNSNKKAEGEKKNSLFSLGLLSKMSSPF